MEIIEITKEDVEHVNTGMMHSKLIADGWEYQEDGDNYFYNHQDFENENLKFNIEQAFAMTTAFKFRKQRNK
jgi:hypothetical protein